MGTAIKHPVPDGVKPSFVIFDIRALWHSAAPESLKHNICQANKQRDLGWYYTLLHDLLNAYSTMQCVTLGLHFY